jgi:hypothetical protein
MLDTCVLSTVVEQPALRDWVARWLKDWDLICYVSVHSLEELVGDIDNKRENTHAIVGERLKGLRALRGQVGERLREAAIFDHAVFAEVNQPQSYPVENFETPSHLEKMTTFEDQQLHDVLLWARTPASSVNHKKGTLHKLDRSIHAEVQSLLQESPEGHRELAQSFSVANVVRQINGREIPHYLCGLVAERMTGGKMTPEQVEERLPYFPVLNCAEQLVGRAYLANGARPDAKQEEIGLFRTRKKKGLGDWVDHYIAATAAACAMFITGDDKLFRRCAHIRRLGVSGINPYRAEELIAGYSVAPPG